MDDEKREFRMYYHGVVEGRVQRSKVAVSTDGLNFEASPESLGEPYFRVFQWTGYHYALGMPGVFYRSEDGLTNFEQGSTLFPDNMRHTALDIEGDTLKVFYTNASDSPERILLSTIDLSGDWSRWKASEPDLVLEPETEYEGAELPAAPSSRGSGHGEGPTAKGSRHLQGRQRHLPALFRCRRAGNRNRPAGR